MIELFVFILFLVVTVIGVISCFAELSSLLQSGAINHLTMEALHGGLNPDCCLSRKGEPLAMPVCIASLWAEARGFAIEWR